MKVKRSMQMELKQIGEDGVFEGLLSPYGKVDLTGDVVMPGAYTKTLQEHGNKVPMLWQHRADTPIGELTLEDRPDGLWCKGQLLLALADAQKAYLLIKARIVKGLSIGFETIRDSVEGSVRQLKEIRLYEGSIVTFPAAESALITSVKAAMANRETKGDFTEELTEIQLLDAGYQMRGALREALCSMLCSGLTKEEIISGSETIIQQFQETYLAYLPAYIDLMAEFYGGMEMFGKRSMETKAGRTISAATKTTLMTAHDHMKSAVDLIYPLLTVDAEDGTDNDAGITSKSEAGKDAKPAPDFTVHSALLDDWKSKLQAIYQ